MIFRQTELYKFLNFCNNNGLEKKVLDCGAGGNMPPLALFKEYGYETEGIEISDSQMAEAEKFQKDHSLELNINKGDMRNLSFENETFSFVYSYNSIFHMPKEEIKVSIDEIKRVLKKGGLCFINVLSKDDFGVHEGKPAGEGQFLQEENGEWILHSYYDDEEADKYFEGMDIIFKQKRTFEWYYEGEKIIQSYIDYIVKK